jgi:hypothetical protein
MKDQDSLSKPSPRLPRWWHLEDDRINQPVWGRRDCKTGTTKKVNRLTIRVEENKPESDNLSIGDSMQSILPLYSEEVSDTALGHLQAAAVKLQLALTQGDLAVQPMLKPLILDWD